MHNQSLANLLAALDDAMSRQTDLNGAADQVLERVHTWAPTALDRIVATHQLRSLGLTVSPRSTNSTP